MNKIIEQTEILRNGNTNSLKSISKQSIQYKHWAFTINNYDDNIIRDLEINIKAICIKAIIGKEIGENGTPHLQGQMTLIKKMRLTELKKINGFEKAHFEKTKNIKASEKYCAKDENILIKYGYPKDIETISHLNEWQQSLYNLLNLKANNRDILYIFESGGNVGKSSFCKYIIVKDIFKIGYCDGGKKNDIINMVYNLRYEPEVIFIDMPRECMGRFSYSAVEALKNGMIFNSKFESGFKIFNSPHVVIFSNYPPMDTTLLSNDRWKIYEIKENKLTDYILESVPRLSSAGLQ